MPPAPEPVLLPLDPPPMLPPLEPGLEGLLEPEPLPGLVLEPLLEPLPELLRPPDFMADSNSVRLI